MPQFDQFSFFNQVFYFLFFFINFYFFITYYCLPTICYNIKFRKKKTNFDLKKTTAINFEKKNSSFFFDSSYKKFCSSFELFFTQKFSIYQQNQINEFNKIPLLTKFFNQKVNLFLNKKFLLLKKIFI